MRVHQRLIIIRSESGVTLCCVSCGRCLHACLYATLFILNEHRNRLYKSSVNKPQRTMQTTSAPKPSMHRSMRARPHTVTCISPTSSPHPAPAAPSRRAALLSSIVAITSISMVSPSNGTCCVCWPSHPQHLQPWASSRWTSPPSSSRKPQKRHLQSVQQHSSSDLLTLSHAFKSRSSCRP